MVPQYKKIGTALITAILLGLFLAGSGLMTSWAKNEVIEVPGGDVEALYAAVYDEDGLPRDNVEIVLEPGVFFLEQEDKPFGGRLVLGDNTILRSTLDLPLNDDFVPTGEDPCQTGEETACGAIIDGSKLPDPDNAFDESYIVTGNGSTVSRLTLQSDLAPGEFGDRIGIQLLPHGTDPTFAVVDKVIVRGTLIGVQIASTTGSNNLGLVRHSWLTENHFGTNVVQMAPDSSGVDDARLEVVASFNLMHDNTEENFMLIAGFGGDRNDMVVSLIDNEFGYGTWASVVVQVLENFIYENEPSSDNRVSFSISGGQISGRTTEEGELEGDGLLIKNPNRFGSEEASSNNVINGQINGVEFVNTATDVVFLHDQGPGQDNQAVLLMRANRHLDDLGGMGQFSVTDNPPENEFQVVGSQTTFEEQNLNFDSAGLEGHFTGTAEETVTGQAAPVAVEEPQQPTSIADLAGVWSRPKPGYPEPGKYLWQLNPDGIDQVLREETVAGKVVKLGVEDYLPNQWSAEGTEWQVVTLIRISDEADIWGCSESGRYEIQPAEGDGIQFVLINDKCTPRREILTGDVWQREAGGE